MNKTILLDLDGVLTDFVGTTLKIFGKEDLIITQEDMVPQLGVTEKEFWDTIDSIGVEFWSNMAETDECNDILSLVMETGCKWIISSSPSMSPCSVIGKIKWLKKKFGNYFHDYMIGGHKYLMANPNHILIDDFARNCSKFVNNGGKAILVPRTWNGYDYLDVVTYIKTRLSELL